MQIDQFISLSDLSIVIWQEEELNQTDKLALGCAFPYQVQNADELLAFHDQLARLQESLRGTAEFATMEGWLSIRVEGNADERGSAEYNLALGQKRAESVRKALTLLGVDDNQIEAISFGKEKPAVAGDTDDSMALNRRAEIVYR